MMLSIARLKSSFRRYASRQKQKLIYRAINPARYLADLARVGFVKDRVIKNAPARPIRMALVSDRDAYCSEEQFTPFSTYRADLRSKLRLITLQLLLKDALCAPRLIFTHFDIIGLKMSYLTSSSDALRVVRTIRNAVNGKCIIYFDGDDDLGVQWPGILPYVDLYIKKHVFRDRLSYLKRFIGKSSLHDYVHHKYGHTFSARDYVSFLGDKSIMISESGPVPIDQLPKISLGYNLALDRIIMNLYKDVQQLAPTSTKENDIIFRGNVPKEVWTYHLRKDIEPVLRRLEKSYRIIMPDKKVPPKEYYREMTSSKICISPFGYGEICWRDFEAILCRCLLIKPDMSHVETNPDIFRPYETYVPVKWDYSDLEEKCTYYLANESERERLVAQAFKVLGEFYKKDGFIKAVTNIIESLPAVVR
jgi:hypothetical protein